MELRVSGDRLDGPAADWFRDEAAKAQFLFIGEEHDTREIPLILGALWGDLVPLGYRHVAIEAGQWLGGTLDEYARSGDLASLARFKAAALPRRPNISVPPSSDEDIAFYGRLGREARPRGVADPPLIWGLDHEFKMTPLLGRLSELTPDPERRRQVRDLLSKVGASERSGDYDVRPFGAEIAAIGRAFSPAPRSETARILDAMEKRAGASDDPGRGALMKRLFLRDYRAAQAAGEEHPRVMLRFGSWHGKRGLGYKGGASTLANFVAELAVGEEARMLNVIFIGCSDAETDPPGHPRPCSPQERIWLKPFKDAAASRWTLYDLRGLRPRLRDGSLGAGWELVDMITGYDAVVWLTATEPGHFSQ
jgi:hypothetical protein